MIVVCRAVRPSSSPLSYGWIYLSIVQSPVGNVEPKIRRPDRTAAAGRYELGADMGVLPIASFRASRQGCFPFRDGGFHLCYRHFAWGLAALGGADDGAVAFVQALDLRKELRAIAGVLLRWRFQSRVHRLASSIEVFTFCLPV